jgi:hypothetical protein
MERVMGIEPTLSAWKAEVLPLNYTRTTRHSTLRLYIYQHIVTYFDDTPVRTLQAKSENTEKNNDAGGGGRIRTFEG